MSRRPHHRPGIRTSGHGDQPVRGRRGGGDDAANLPTTYPAFAEVAAEISAETGNDVTAYQVTLSWLRSNGDAVVPIAAVTRTATADINAASANVELTVDQIARLDASPVGTGSVFPDDED